MTDWKLTAAMTVAGEGEVGFVGLKIISFIPRDWDGRKDEKTGA